MKGFLGILWILTTAFAAAENLCQNSVWGQCGGETWVKEGKPTCCSSGSTCVPQAGNKWYSQCIPQTTATGCSKLWQQCGGENWTGSQCCASGSTCIPQANNKYYSQCLPVEDSVPTPAPTTQSSDECSPRWGQCGGVNWVASGNPTCCSGANTCVPQAGNIWYSQCLPITESTPTSAPVGSCSPIYGQCGGTNWVAEGKPTCCASGTVCIPQVNNPWYSQCLPGLPTPTATPSASPTQIDQPSAMPTTDGTNYCAHAAYIINGCVCNVAGGYKIVTASDGSPPRCLLDPLPDCENNQLPPYEFCTCNVNGGLYKLVKGRCLLLVTPSCIHNQHPTSDNCVCDVSAGKFQLIAQTGFPKVCVSIPLPTCVHNDILDQKECHCDVGPNFKLFNDAGSSTSYCVSIPLPVCATRAIPSYEHCLCDPPAYKIINDHCYPSSTQFPACTHNQTPSQDECTCTGDLYETTDRGFCVLKDANTWPACTHLQTPSEYYCKCDTASGNYEVVPQPNGGPDICVSKPRPPCVDGDEIARKFCDCTMTGFRDLNGICRPDSFHLTACKHGQEPTSSNCECLTSAGFELYHPPNYPSDTLLCLRVPRPDCAAGDRPTVIFCACNEATGFKEFSGVCQKSDYVPTDCVEGDDIYTTQCNCNTATGFKAYSDGTCHSVVCAAGQGSADNCGCDTDNGYVMNYNNDHTAFTCDLLTVCTDGEYSNGDTLCKCDAVDGLQVYSDGTCHDPNNACVDGQTPSTDACWCNVYDNAFTLDYSGGGDPVCKAVPPA